MKQARFGPSLSGSSVLVIPKRVLTSKLPALTQDNQVLIQAWSGAYGLAGQVPVRSVQYPVCPLDLLARHRFASLSLVLNLKSRRTGHLQSCRKT